MEKQYFDQFFRDFHFVGCAIRSPEIVYLLGRQLYELEDGEEDPTEKDVSKRVVNILLARPPEKRYGKVDLDSFGILNLAVSQQPKPHLVAVDYGRQVFIVGSGYNDVEPPIRFHETQGPARGTSYKVKAIDGYVYSVGSSRSVCKRVGLETWVPIWEGLPVPQVESRPELGDYGFADIDGFNANDLYAAGGEGDVWHYNGKRWSQIDFPSDRRLYNVCCGGNGFVYISGHYGTTYKGRGKQWQMVSEGGADHWFKDVGWFDGSLWGTNDFGLWRLGAEGFERPDVPSFVSSSAGYLACGHGLMVVAGMYGAALHDGQQWQPLVDLVDLYKRYGQEG